MKTARFSELLSHPDRYLEQHISQVWHIAEKLFEKDKINEELLKGLLKIIIFSHDLGKATDYFQQYIRGDKSVKNKPETKHSLLGAVIGFYLADRYLKSKNIENDFLLSLAFILPKRHHSDLKFFYEDITLHDDEIEILKKQINSIDRKKFQLFFENLSIENKDILAFSFDEIDLDKIKIQLKKLRRFFRKIISEENLFYYTTAVLLFSYLIDADKSDAGIKENKEILFKNVSLPSNLVENYIKKQNFKPTQINKLRTIALQEAINKEIDINKKIYSLTLPTGMGKTVISFAFALKLSEKLQKEKNISPKIIYSLPFLSIIEQNFTVFEKILKENGINPDSLTILKHHHLSEITFRFEDNQFDFETSRVLIEGWNSKIIVTTFLQLFYTLIGYKNKTLRKFHNLTNSILILDEIQSIPPKYWLIIREITKYLSQKYNFYVIFSTATQPLIIEEKETIQIVNYKKYFNKFNRYTVKVSLKLQSIEEFTDSLALQKNKRYLFITNTVNQAKDIYEKLKNFEPIFLSTHIVPKERLKRIKKLKDQKTKIAVSTQLVEAGVDVDFDVVYRDLAPFDSLIQSAGRCNRESRLQKGEVYVVNLIDHNKRPFSSYIYDAVLIQNTKKILKENFEEKDVLHLIKKYFEEILKTKSLSESKELLQHLYGLKFSADLKQGEINSIADFKLIEELPFKNDVFVQTDEEAVRLWDEFTKIRKIKDIFERKKAFSTIKKDFYEYLISVPIKDNIPPVENGFYFVPLENLEEYYDLETGFKIKGEVFYSI